MGIVKVLKRKDGASLVVGVTLAVLVADLAGTIAKSINSNFSYGGQGVQVGPGWTVQYLQPLVVFVLEVLVLELLVWLYVGAHSAMAGNKK